MLVERTDTNISGVGLPATGTYTIVGEADNGGFYSLLLVDESD